jgi:hypothetical protein
VTGNNTLSGSITGKLLNYLYVGGNNTLSGSITDMINLTVLVAGNNNTLTGSISALINLTQLIVLGNNTISGSVSALVNLGTLQIIGSGITTLDCYALASLTNLQQYNNSNLTSIVTPTSTANLNMVYLYSDALTTIDFTNTTNIGGDIRIYSNSGNTTFTLPATLTRAITRLDAHGNALNLTSVDDALAKLDAWYTANTPTANLTVDFTGGTNTSPTGGNSNVNKAHLESIFSAAGKLATIIVN